MSIWAFFPYNFSVSTDLIHTIFLILYLDFFFPLRTSNQHHTVLNFLILPQFVIPVLLWLFCMLFMPGFHVVLLSLAAQWSLWLPILSAPSSDPRANSCSRFPCSPICWSFQSWKWHILWSLCIWRGLGWHFWKLIDSNYPINSRECSTLRWDAEVLKCSCCRRARCEQAVLKDSRLFRFKLT